MAFFASALLLGMYSAAQGLDLPRAALIAVGRVVALSDNMLDEGGDDADAVPALSRAIMKDVLPLYRELGPERTPRLSWKERLSRAAQWAVGWVPGDSASALASALPYLSRELGPRHPVSTTRPPDPVVRDRALSPQPTVSRPEESPPPGEATVREPIVRKPPDPEPPISEPSDAQTTPVIPDREPQVTVPDREPQVTVPDRKPEVTVPDRGPQVTVPDRVSDEQSGEAARPDGRTQRTGPIVLVYHSHTSEMYRTDTFFPEEPDDYHRWNTTDTGVVKVGARLVTRLREKYQIPAIHVKTIHDYPVHAYAYAQSEKTVKAVLEQYPSIQVVIDLHRDGVESPLTVSVNGEETAQVALVLATAKSSQLSHPGWKRNEAFAARFEEQMQALYPSMDRRVIRVNTARYNQQLHPHSILVEVGSYSTELDAALRAADRLADVLAALIPQLSASVAAQGGHAPSRQLDAPPAS